MRLAEDRMRRELVRDAIDQNQSTPIELLATIAPSIGSMEVVMANMQLAEARIAAQDDYAEHVRGYRNFVRGVQLVVAGLATALVLLAVFLL